MPDTMVLAAKDADGSAITVPVQTIPNAWAVASAMAAMVKAVSK